MADLKYHWAIPVSDPSKHQHAWKAYVGGHYVQACGRKYTTALAETAVLFVAKVKANSDWYCSDCARAARLALAQEGAPKPVSNRPARSCSNCRSGAINPGHHGRAEDTDLDLCDVCYWRKRAESATWPKPRPISEAPKDGPEIMGWCPGYGWRHLYLDLTDAWVAVGTPHRYQPTHFLPLPPSPEVK